MVMGVVIAALVKALAFRVVERRTGYPILEVPLSCASWEVDQLFGLAEWD
jgi:hypothetical protein